MDLGIGDECFLRLLALLVKDTKIVPDLWLQSID